MKRKRAISVLLSAAMLLQIFALDGCSTPSLKIYDKQGAVIAELKNQNLDKIKLADEGYRSYLEIVLDEAIVMIAQKEQCEEKEAEELLFERQHNIYTSFDPQVYQSLKKTYSDYKEQELSFGAAVTDTHGKLLATYGVGHDGDEYQNCAALPTPPYSSFKPLSVYAPAMEKGILSWSKTYEDSPVKQVEGEDGTMRDWPANASGTYLNEPVCVNDAIRQSLNTIAVKCLQDYGVRDSIAYLEENFGLSLAYEASVLDIYGEEEILGNVALGYLYFGVSPVQMAGYYQAFANGGIYIEPRAVMKICDSQGELLTESKAVEKRVMNYETAYVMNLLLQGVVSQKGTGRDARIENIPVGGKTGTGDQGNWFVGFTPEYTCALWHGTELMQNETTEMFAKAVSQFPQNADTSFPECKTVEVRSYCMESGMFFSSKCRKMDKGYYTSIDTTEKCNIHSK